jgi:hypothetical protein
MKINRIILVFNLVILVFTGILICYYSPYLAAKKMKVAIEENNETFFFKNIDYPSVYEGLRRNLDITSYDDVEFDTGNVSCDVISSVLNDGIKSYFVNKLLSIDNIKYMLAGRDPSSSIYNKSYKYSSGNKDNILISILSVDEFSLTIEKDEYSEAQPLIFSYKRSGLNQWKLSDIKLPNLKRITEQVSSKQAEMNVSLKSICLSKLKEIKKGLVHKDKAANKIRLPNNVKDDFRSANSRVCKIQNQLRLHGYAIPRSHFCNL